LKKLYFRNASCQKTSYRKNEKYKNSPRPPGTVGKMGVAKIEPPGSIIGKK
jgi:hypothetical protein